MLKKLIKKMTNNFGLKMMALLMAFVLWIVVVNIDDPRVPAQYTTSVTQENVNYLTENGKYSEPLGGSNKVTFTVSAKKSYHEKLSNSDFVAVADMEKIEDTGKKGMYRVPVVITCSKYDSSRVSISSKQPYLEIEVEDLGNVQKRISAVTEGKVMAGCAVGDVEITTSNLLKISGPSSVTSKIDTVTAAINVNGMSSDVTDTVVPVLYDAQGNVIDTTKLKLSLNTVTITAQILNTKRVPIEFSTSGSAAPGYLFQGIAYHPETVNIKGEASVLNMVNKIVIPPEVLDISGMTATIDTVVDITPYLPKDTTLVSAADAKVSVKLKMEEIVDKTFELPASAFTLKNVPSGFKAKIADSKIPVTVTGLKSDIDKLSKDKIAGTIDLTGTKAGEQSVSAEIELDDSIYQVKRVRVSVNLSSLADNASKDTTSKTGTKGSKR